MIQQNELRKSNLVLYNGEVREVASINSDDTIRLWQDKPAGYTIGCLMLSEVSGIELTKEWIHKLNFNERIFIDDNFYDVFCHDESFEGIDEQYWFSINNEDIVVLKSVSHLQNVFFYITGQELTIKE